MVQNDHSEEERLWQHQNKFNWIVEKVSLSARISMFQSFMKLSNPTENCKVLDVGVTSNRRADSNIFEKNYPFPHNITAMGIDDASFLEVDFPGLKFVSGNALEMPFEDKQFDIATSWATIEHVGSRANQRKFVDEMLRVSKKCLITTPNRWYPLEFHTVTPLIHWLPPNLFRSTLNKFGMEFYAKEENLNLLGAKDFLELVPADVTVSHRHYRLMGPVSNLVFLLDSTA